MKKFHDWDGIFRTFKLNQKEAEKHQKAIDENEKEKELEEN